jgi:hypothetical protein
MNKRRRRPQAPGAFNLTSDVLLFQAYDGDCWSRDDWANWRNRVFGPAAVAAELEKSRPYDLRHSFCSLLIHEGATVVEVARQLGHSPTMTLNTYGHVFDELQGAEPRRSRSAEHAQSTCPFCVRLRLLDSYQTSKSQQNPCKPTMGGAGLEPATSCL